MTTYDHGSRVSEVGTLSYSQMSGGDLVEFEYQKPDSTDTRRVFVVEPNHEDRLHGLDIQYLSEPEIVKLYRQTQEDMFGEAEEETFQLDLPELTVGDIGDGNSFYENVIDGFITSADQNAYRTFEHSKIVSPIPRELVYETVLESQIDNFEFYDSPES